jgi:hypothetical protein
VHGILTRQLDLQVEKNIPFRAILVPIALIPVLMNDLAQILQYSSMVDRQKGCRESQWILSWQAAQSVIKFISESSPERLRLCLW